MLRPYNDDNVGINAIDAIDATAAIAATVDIIASVGDSGGDD